MGSTPTDDDTTLRSLSERPPRVRARLIAVCVASNVLAEPRVVELDPGTLEIGRATGPAGIGLEADRRVSRRHASLQVSPDGRATIESIAGAPLEINGRAVTRAPVHDGDVVLLGASAMVFRDTLGPADTSPIEGVLGGSPAICAVRRSIAKVAAVPMTVLLLGESGTGKEVTARALHRLSRRAGPFVAVNCAAIPASLAESELFGYSAGAFTGALKASAGVFRAAQGGTLFLDELGDLPLELQPKLLRALEERSVVAVGSTTPTPIDVRVVTATNRDLITEVKAGRFRGDLFARLAEFTLHLPPLRDRREDILTILAHQYSAPLDALRFDVVRALLVHPWPFNVRELRTIAAQLRLLSEDGELGLSAIAERLGSTARLLEPDEPAERDEDRPDAPSDERRPPDREELEKLLRAHQGNVTDVARAAGRSRKQVYRWLEAHGIDPVRFRE